MISPAEYEAALQNLENNPPDIRDLNDNIREERWTGFPFESVKFPTLVVGCCQGLWKSLGEWVQ